MLQLRGSQPHFVKKGVDLLHSKSTAKSVLVAPVAYGKSICIANIVKELDGPVIILQPNKELLEQNYGKYTSYGFEASIFSASLGKKEISHVTYATIGSIKSHVEAVREQKVKYLIIDECHLGTGRTSQVGKFIEDAKIKNILGVTATPILLRSGFDGAMLKTMDSVKDNIFSNISHVVQIGNLVKAGYWADLEYDIKVTHMDGLQYNSNGSDYTIQSMKMAYSESATHSRVMEAVEDLRSQGRKSIIVFVPTVQAAMDLKKAIPNSGIVHGKMKKKARENVLEAFKSLDLDVVINVEVLTTGFDHPQLDAIVMARPTASIALYYQILGRGTRIHPDKENTRIVDLSGNVSNFGPIESLNYEYIDGYGWGMFTGDILLTNTPIKAKRKPTKAILKQRATKEGIRSIAKDLKHKMWFGKYKDQTLENIPHDYLNWALENLTFNGVRMTALKKSMETVLNLR